MKNENNRVLLFGLGSFLVGLALGNLNGIRKLRKKEKEAEETKQKPKKER